MRSRRAIRTVFVFALLGALATVLSAWAIHLAQYWQRRSLSHWATGWHSIEPKDFPLARNGQPGSIEVWRGYRVFSDDRPEISDTGSSFAQQMQLRGVAWRVWLQRVSPWSEASGSRPTSDEVLLIFDAGWPVLAMRHGSYSGEFVQTDYTAHATETSRISLRGGFQIDLPRSIPPPGHYRPTGLAAPVDRFALPLLPLWPGFLINTLFYALLLCIAWRLPGVLRRAVRRRRGRCVGCGYDRDGLDPGAACPECGEGAGAR